MRPKTPPPPPLEDQPEPLTVYTASELASAAGRARRTVSNYLRDGRIAPFARTARGQLLFRADAVVTLTLTKEATR